jgi:hypothetical protein
VCAVYRQWRREFATEPPTRLPIARVRDKFGSDDTVHDVQKQRSGRPCTPTNPASSAMVLEQFTGPPQKSVKQFENEIGFRRSRGQRILKRAKWKVYIPRLLHAMNEDSSDRRAQFCDRFQHKAHKDEKNCLV